ncbi:succinate dehydrogenase, hydrophobic membrane anchor protein [Candidatus Pantoea edessiphila]|uniref:Succinate dehydrogenase hydrophobic membrane anchor subunit n=1 Tax=Candidatus Pantoea edessiphila TaxID=2044610 RepID=A0A2P5SX04_9GAMM|nr:succinate dehydrogenase, hydrophobic membrane anchor protein [Candidatus Pantoea edessiphila]PPI86878.1 succinate dehydrogenase, hydrophobic membrane anchor protein [Candidatus Pantoea edessiphila]
MVNNTFALSRKGIQDWLILRIAAIIIFLYIIYICTFLIHVDELNYYTWHNFFQHTVTKIFTMLMILSVLIHGWIGVWQVLTDYVKLVFLRLIIQLIIILGLISYAIYGFIIVCGG